MRWWSTLQRCSTQTVGWCGSSVYARVNISTKIAETAAAVVAGIFPKFPYEALALNSAQLVECYLAALALERDRDTGRVRALFRGHGSDDRSPQVHIHFMG
jgi:hypothetical protein